MSFITDDKVIFNIFLNCANIFITNKSKIYFNLCKCRSNYNTRNAIQRPTIILLTFIVGQIFPLKMSNIQ